VDAQTPEVVREVVDPVTGARIPVTTAPNDTPVVQPVPEGAR
jgi:hypothetical protein